MNLSLVILFSVCALLDINAAMSSGGNALGVGFAASGIACVGWALFYAGKQARS